MESVSFGKKARKGRIKMTEWALAHPYMTLCIALFLIYAVNQAICNLIGAIVAIALRNRTGNVIVNVRGKLWSVK